MKSFLILLFFLTPSIYAFSQHYTVSSASGGFDRGAQSSADGVFYNISNNNNLTQWVDLPFEWSFYGTEVSQFKLSENGYVVFNPSSATSSVGSNVSLASTTAPDNSIFAFWDDFESNHLISTWIMGLGENRIFKISWNFSEISGVLEDYSFDLMLYENCGDFDIVLNKYPDLTSGLSGTIGCKKDNTTYTEVATSPNHTGLDYQDQLYSFHYETAIEHDLALIALDIGNHLTLGSHPIKGSLRNKGNQEVNSFDLNYQVNNGPTQTTSVTGVAIHKYTAVYEFTHSIPLQVSSAGEQLEIDFWVDNVNGSADQRECNSEIKKFVTGINGTSTADRKVLIEKITGTWCPSCISGIVLFDDILESNENIIGIAAHNPYASEPMRTASSLNLKRNFLGSAYPSAMINRKGSFNSSEMPSEFLWSSWSQLTTAELNSFSPVDVSISNLYYQDTREVVATVTLNYSDFSAGSGYGILLMTVADEMYNFEESGWSQANGGNSIVGHPYYNQGSSVDSFIHKHVLRDYIDSDCYGVQGIIPNFVSSGDEISHEFNFTLPAEYDYDNITLVAAVVKKETSNDNGYSGPFGSRFVLNSEETPLNLFIQDTTQTSVFEINQQVVSAFPNPTNNIVYFNFEENNKPSTVKIFDFTGKLLKENVKLISNEIDFSNFNQGIYLVQFKKEGKILGMAKIVKKDN